MYRGAKQGGDFISLHHRNRSEFWLYAGTGEGRGDQCALFFN